MTRPRSVPHTAAPSRSDGTGDVAAALLDTARGTLPAEAAVGLLGDHGAWLRRSDFRAAAVVVVTGPAGAPVSAEIDWPAAVRAVEAGDLPCSSAEAQILALAASLGSGYPVDLAACLTGLDGTNTRRVLVALAHAAGHPEAAGRPGQPGRRGDEENA